MSPQARIAEFSALYAEHDQQILSDWFHFLRFPTISADQNHRSDLRCCLDWLQSYLQAAGLKTEVWESSGQPTLYAEWLHAGADKPTVLIYNHYDVQPVDPLELWTTPPFDPSVRDGAVYARGAQDNKGQCFYVLSAIRYYLERYQTLPVNLKLCIEGEEEIGSPGLASILAAKRKQLAADYLLIVDLGLPSSDTPAVCLGVRGITALTVEIKGSATDLHSGSHGGVVYNPLHALVEILAALRDRFGKILVPGFYDDIVPTPQTETEKLLKFFDVGVYERKFGTKAVGGETEYSPIESAWLRPTLEINGISGGYAGEGLKTVIPSIARAKISCRLVPNQDPEKIAALVGDYLRSLVPDAVELTVTVHPGGGKALRTPFDSPVVRAVAQAYTEVFEKPCGYTLEGASIPIVTALGEATQSQVVLMGFGLDSDNMHAPDEHFSIDRLRTGFVTILRILEILGDKK